MGRGRCPAGPRARDRAARGGRRSRRGPVAGLVRREQRARRARWDLGLRLRCAGTVHPAPGVVRAAIALGLNRPPRVDRCRSRGVASPSLSNIRSISPRDVPGRGDMAKRFDELIEVRVERDAGMPSAFVWRGRRYEIADVIGRWRIEGRWWADGRDREYWRVEARGGAVWDLYHDRLADRWHLERLWD